MSNIYEEYNRENETVYKRTEDKGDERR